MMNYEDDQGYDSDPDSNYTTDAYVAYTPRPRVESVDELEPLKKFPVSLSIEGSVKTVVSLMDNWHALDGGDIVGSKHHGIYTGVKNGITVIDCHAQFEVDLDDLRTLKVQTPGRGTYYIFRYEASLHSIYDTLPGVSVINDDRCVFFGKGYRRIDQEIKTMPDHLRELLERAQDKITKGEVLPYYYELINILPTDSFNDEEIFTSIVYAFRNELLSKTSGIRTMHKLLTERYGYYHDRILTARFNITETGPQYRNYTFTRLERMIKKAHTERYKLWKTKWDRLMNSNAPAPEQNTLTARVRYKEGALTKFADIKAIYPTRKITSAELLEIDARFTMVRKMICQSCQKRFLKNCCKDYHNDRHSSCTFINNIELV